MFSIISLEGLVMPIKKSSRVKMFNVSQPPKNHSVGHKISRVYLAINKHDKDIAFTLEADRLISLSTHLPAFNHKQAWSFKYAYLEIFEKCKDYGVKEIRVYVADEAVYEKTKEISNNLARIASGYGVMKVDVFILKNGEYEYGYQLAEQSIKRMNRNGESESIIVKESYCQFEFDFKHPREYQSKLLFKKPLFIGKNHSQHKKDKVSGLKVNTAVNERNFRNVMVELLENEASIKLKTREAMKYVNEILYKDGMGYISLEGSTLQEWTCDWVETITLNQVEGISVTHLENYLIAKVEAAKNHLDRFKSHGVQPVLRNRNNQRVLAIA